MTNAWVYILRSHKDNKLYTGATTDLKRRLREHEKGKVRSTKYRLPIELVYFEKYSSIGAAKAREYELKQPTLGKTKKVMIKEFDKNKLKQFAESREASV